MPVHSVELTDKIAAKLPAPSDSYTIFWCPRTAGFGVRVTAGGARAWISERRIDGKPTRRTLGTAPGSVTLRRSFGNENAVPTRMPASGVITAKAARAKQLDISSELERGQDRLDTERAARVAAKIESVTFEKALRQYVKTKRRKKDGLHLKERTKNDYLAMVAPAGVTKRSKKPTLCGPLHSLADKPLHRITAGDITKLYIRIEPRGERQQTYAMQVLRAVLRHEGIAIEDNPLAATTAGSKRVTLAPSRGNPSPIPAEKLGAWWRAACAAESVSGDMLRWMLLTGARPGEAAGLLARDVDDTGMRATLKDTKNRRDHIIVQSTQAAAIVYWHTQGKRPGALVFGIVDPGKTLRTINAAAKTPSVTPHKLRHSFASIADDLVTAATARVMLNHASGDVTQQHYIGISEAKLRAGWQAVADFIEAAK